MHGERVTAIRISARNTGGALVIAGEDDGVGIPDNYREKIFENGCGRNAGPGLFLCREIPGTTGIAISGTGTSGKGARFEMTVPEGGYRSAPRDGTG